MKQLPIVVKSGGLAKCLQNTIYIDQVIPSHSVTEEYPDNKITIRPRVWNTERKRVRLTYKCTRNIQHPSGNYDVIDKWHTDIDFEDNQWKMAPALSSGSLDFETYSNYVGTAQYLAEVIRDIANNSTPKTFQQWKERFFNA